MDNNQKKYTLAFVLVMLCFALWGFGGSVTNPMVKAFSKIFKMSVTDGTMVQLAWYGGYFAMALPAAIFVRRHSYRSGMLLGLSLMAIGSFCFWQASSLGSYYPFLLAYFVVTCGQSFLETAANPFMLTLGDKDKAAYRLNMAQSFNPIGCMLGMYAAMAMVQQRLSPLTAAEREALPVDEFEALKLSDLQILCSPYLLFGIAALLLAIGIWLIKLPTTTENDGGNFPIIATFRCIAKGHRFQLGFIAQFFHMGAQVMCWTFIIQYGTEVFTAQGMSEEAAEVLSQKYNIAAMVLFCLMRFVCTFLMKYVSPARLMAFMSVGAMACTAGVILIGGQVGIYCLVGISGFMSLMFPTIYSLALSDLDGEDAKIGAAGQVMAILGGSLMPMLQAYIIDGNGACGLSPVNISFVVPLLCFAVVLAFSIIISISDKKRAQQHI